MKLKEFIKDVLAFASKHPDALEYDVVYSKDAEGNEFNKVAFEPTLGLFDEDDKDFTPFEEGDDVEDHNAVCIN